jgi:hypothetical protein
MQLLSNLLAVIHNQRFGNYHRQMRKSESHGPILTMTINLLSTEHHRFMLQYIGYWRHRMDSWAGNRSIDLLRDPKRHVLKEKHKFKYYQYSNLQNIQNMIAGCRIIAFDLALLSNTKQKRVIYIHKWTRWATRWWPTHFRRGGRLLSTDTRIDSSGVLTTLATNLAADRFQPEPRPEKTVRNRC